ncbi:MAG: esterase family protein [Muribaculaceae bacterium]|nr:esterase family protein [Muribaculaceae bacterium]
MADKKKRKKWPWLVLGILALLIAIAAWYMRPPSNTIPTASRGTLERFPQFKSQFVPARDVVVWLPESYQTGDSCDVLYMHDGNMLFDATTTWNRQEWRVDEVMDSLIHARKIRPCIVVGIYNTDDRLTEYFPAKTSLHVGEAFRKKTKIDKLTGDAYIQFIIKELKPFIDERYKPLTSREHTFMMGSSMGGLISLYALCEYPQVFGGVACLSSHLSMAHLPDGFKGDAWATGFRDYVDQQLPEVNGSLIYMDHGTEDFDADYGPYQERLDSVIIAKGWDKEHYTSLIFDGDGHNETCWAKRLDKPLLFLLGK